MRKKQILAILLALIFVNVASLSMAIFINGETTLTKNVKDFQAICGTTNLKGRTIETSQSFEVLALKAAEVDLEESWTVTVSDFYNEEVPNYDQEFELVLTGEHCNIWIGLHPEVHEGGYQDEFVPGATFEENVWYFAYPWSNIGMDAAAAEAPDPDNDGYYLPPGYRDWITGVNLLSIRDEFDNNIHDNVLEHFGVYADRPGPLDDYKIQVLIFNMRDGLFYDPINAPWFTIGYFWSYASETNNANIFHMDTYQWWRRQGVEYPGYPYPYGLGYLPLQYEGTFAHEFQHLVNYDVDADELSWVDEGCSMLAEWICGYGFSPGHISEYLIWHWDDSLTFWQGYLSDYGGVFLWTYYMWEHYGGDELIWDLCHEQANGIEGWRKVLPKGKNTKTFDEIFQDWTIANYLDDTSISDGIYGYYGLDIPSEDSEGYSIHSVLEQWRQSQNAPLFEWIVRGVNHEGAPYPYGATLPYTANYVEFYNNKEVSLEFTFDGEDATGIEAYSGEYKLSSNGEAWAWYRVHQTIDLSSVSTATLEFYTFYQIEEDWDYGYVEVYDGSEWCTLQGLNTVNTLPENNGTDNPNCDGGPGDWGLEPTAYFIDGEWNAFTGSSGGWIFESMDLSPFAGKEIELYFTYWTDPYTLEAGFFVDDIKIEAIGFFDDFEEDMGWTIDDGWTRDDVLHDNNFEVNLITITVPYESGEMSFDIDSLHLTRDTEYGVTEFTLFDLASIQQYVVMVAANQPGYEHTFTTSYLWSTTKS
ncbi:MAG: immune inhibitor A [Promethearchaeota archaeon]|nr:MAG: immune inhibitor A [Candidatus Lokiarchaeota archaeon]